MARICDVDNTAKLSALSPFGGFKRDIAPAALIAEETGGTVSGALGQPLPFNTASGEVFGVLVATPWIHAAAVEWLRERAMEVV